MASSGELVVVTWYDAWGASKWAPDSSLKDMASDKEIIHSVGWLLPSDDKSGLTLRASTNPKSEQTGLSLFIPKGCILCVTPVLKHNLERYERAAEKYRD